MAGTLLMVVAFAGRVCVGLVFLLAAGQKMRSWTILSGVIANYRLLPPFLVKPVALLLPPLELLVGVLLLVGSAWSALAAMALLALFAVAMAINLGRGRGHIDCGCGQSFLRQTLHPVLLARNAVLMLLLVPFLLAAGGLSLDLALTGLVAGVAFFLLYLLANTLVSLPRPGRALAV
jgi:hypothetical protein